MNAEGINPSIVTSGFIPSFLIGAEITNDQLHIEFACSNISGMRRSKKRNKLLRNHSMFCGNLSKQYR